MGRRLSRQNGTARLLALALVAWVGLALTVATARAQAPTSLPSELPADFLKKADGKDMGVDPPGSPGLEVPAGPPSQADLPDLPGVLPPPEVERVLGNAAPAKIDPATVPASTEEVPSAAPGPAPASPPPVESGATPAPRDPEVEPTQSPANPVAGATPAATGAGGLPLAVEKPGEPPPATPTSPKGDAAFVLSPDRLPFGRQTVGLTLDVVAPQFINLQREATFKVVVKNSGQSEAMGVVVRDELPEGLAYVSSQPEPTRIGNLLSWELETIPAGSERTISLTVKPTRTGSFDHAATLSMKAGAKNRTQVREPKLKVEQSVSTTRVLKDQPVQFKIVVSNPGDGPVRNVTVQAKLSPGLRHESGAGNDQNLFEQTIDLIKPGDRLVLDTLVADAVQGGEQSCHVVAHSDDVVPNAAESSSQQSVTVIEPKLDLTITGPKDRYTDTLASYEIVVTNPGTATAENVKVQATLPISGRLYALPTGARFDPQTRRLSWSHGPLEPGGKVSYTFQLRMGGVGLYEVAAESKADGGVGAQKIAHTDVTGLADVDLTVSENRRFIDVNDSTTFVIKVMNRGTADATNLLISGKLTDTIVPIETSGTETRVKWNEKESTLSFPLIERLGPG
ncbi:MAG: hypothetical protein AB7I30_21065, partial [Isosphaeraceae bacterium]